jgi:hypothetical protein
VRVASPGAGTGPPASGRLAYANGGRAQFLIIAGLQKLLAPRHFGHGDLANARKRPLRSPPIFGSASPAARVVEVPPHPPFVELVADDIGDRDREHESDRDARDDDERIPRLLWAHVRPRPLDHGSQAYRGLSGSVQMGTGQAASRGAHRARARVVPSCRPASIRRSDRHIAIHQRRCCHP